MKRTIVIVLLTVVLTVVCLGIGVVAFLTINGGLPTNNPFDVQSVSAQVEENKTLKIDAEKPVVLSIVDDAGDVTVTGAEVDTVQVKAVKTAYAGNQADADQEVKGVKYNIEQTGNKITIKYELPKNLTVNGNLNTVDFVITVPNETTVDMDNNSGDVALTQIKGNATIALDFGNTTLENIAGAVDVRSNGGNITAGSITAGSENISLHSDFGSLELKKADGKDVTITSNSGQVTLTDVRATGKVDIQTDFGKTTYENGSTGELRIDTNSGDVNVSKVRVSGAITVEDDFGQIEFKQVSANAYDLKSNGGNIIVDGAKGKLKAHTDFGKIVIENATEVTLDLKSNGGAVEFSGSLGDGPHLVASDFGEITLTLPADATLNVDIQTDFGKIKSDLPIAVTFSGETNTNSGDDITGTINGGGAQLTVKTNGGNVNLNAGK